MGNIDKERNNGSSGVSAMIYLSHCLSAWGDRMWDFAVGLYMVILYPDSLLLTALLGFAISLAVISFGSLLGSWIDNTKRIKAATVSIIVQNLAVTLGATTLAILFAYRESIQTTWNGALEYVIYAVIIIFSIIAKLGSVASDIAIGRDWIVVLTNGDEKRLATMNAVMRTIDLTTKILAPVAIGTLISFWSQISGAVFIAIWNIISGIVEVYILHIIYKKIPELDYKEICTSGQDKNVLKECWKGWKMYGKHPVKWIGIGFSCLYMSVLGLDQITIGYMYSQGVGESLTGIISALSAIVGIVGSVSYPFLRQCAGPKSTVMIGYFTNTACLTLCVISIFLPGSPFIPSAILNPFEGSSSEVQHITLSLSELWEQHKNLYCFVAGIVFARFGLWITDLCVAQILQDRVEETKRGAINGVQNALNQTMDMIKFILVILLPSAETFGYLIGATWIFGCFGWILHCFATLKSQDKENDSSKYEPESKWKDSPYSSKNSLNEQTPLLS